LPSTFAKRRIAYELFIGSPDWAAIKSRYRKSDLPQTCIVCGTADGLHLHHTTYERFGGGELLTDLMPLCGEHHMGWHRRDGKCLTPSEQKLVRAHLVVLGRKAYETSGVILVESGLYKRGRAVKRAAKRAAKRADERRAPAVDKGDLPLTKRQQRALARAQACRATPMQALRSKNGVSSRKTKRSREIEAHEPHLRHEAARPCRRCGTATRCETSFGTFCSSTCSRRFSIALRGGR
jgi:hypothetical protein